MRVAIYPGSFDPITFGHMDIVDRAVHLFDKVIISVAETDMKILVFFRGAFRFSSFDLSRQ